MIAIARIFVAALLAVAVIGTTMTLTATLADAGGKKGSKPTSTSSGGGSSGGGKTKGVSGMDLGSGR